MSSSTERQFTKSWRFRLATTAAAAPLLIAANCNTNTSHTTEQENTPIPASSQTPDITPSPQASVETPISNPTFPPEPTISSPSGKKTIETDENGYLLIKDTGYTYTIDPQMTIDRLLGKPGTKAVGILDNLSQYIPPYVVNTIKLNLNQASEAETKNPNDPSIAEMIIASANILNQFCDSTNPWEKSYMGGLGSELYVKDPSKLDENKEIFFEGKCFWGVKTIASQEHQSFKIESGLTLYTNVTYDDLLNKDTLSKLQPLYVQKDSFSNLRDYITMARNLEKANAEPARLREDLDKAAYYVLNKCEQSADSREYMRLILSLVYEKYPDYWPQMSHYEGPYNASGCNLIDQQP